MPLAKNSSDLSRVSAVMRSLAADQVPVMLTPRQYVWVGGVICMFMGLLIVPLIMTFAPAMTWRGALSQLGYISFAIVSQMGANYVLRYGNNPLRRWFDQRPFWLNALLRVLVCLSVAAAYGLLRYYIEIHFHVPSERPHRIINAIAASQIFALIIMFIQVAVETLERSQFVMAENERLKQEQLQARYEGLKHQLSPHFLFNSLSTLGGLIYDEPTEAGKFVEEMSLVYRYLLRHGEHTTVSLKEELTFLHSYFFLLRTRFGESLQLEVDLPDDILERQLPPLALQLLVENAVKHNVLTRRQPLRIRIEFSAPATLLVRNNRQPRLTAEPSSGVGLSNLTNRIRLLHRQDLLVDQHDDEFRVYVPLPA
jgi:sensor histidine kinase YesM